jgi:hypothetical protein
MDIGTGYTAAESLYLLRVRITCIHMHRHKTTVTNSLRRRIVLAWLPYPSLV